MKATQTCSVAGCDKPGERSRPICSMHRARMARHGNYEGLQSEAPPAVRFERYVDRTPDGCWLWTGMRNNNGYGKFYDGERQVYAHRWSYEHHVGPIGDLHVMHSCDTPACVAPAHLSLGTPAENAADKVAKGRSTRDTCAAGHEWTPETTRTFTNDRGHTVRRCITCVNDRRRERRKQAR